MGKVIDLKNPVDEATIEIPRTDEFGEAARRLSEYIHGLPLDEAQNDKLVALMVEQVKVAEREGFYFGMQLGMELKAAIDREGVR